MNISDLINNHIPIDIENCPHCCTNGDNYGRTCIHCGEVVSGFGFGGWFGMNLKDQKMDCKHVVSNGQCIYCEAEL